MCKRMQENINYRIQHGDCSHQLYYKSYIYVSTERGKKDKITCRIIDAENQLNGVRWVIYVASAKKKKKIKPPLKKFRKYFLVGSSLVKSIIIILLINYQQRFRFFELFFLLYISERDHAQATYELLPASWMTLPFYRMKSKILSVPSRQWREKDGVLPKQLN